MFMEKIMEKAPEILIRRSRPGDASYVSHLHMTLYQKDYGFRGIFEYYVMKGMAEFLNDRAGGELWVAVIDDRIVGSIAIVRVDDATAQLRWFIVSHDHQGAGIGKRLMNEAMAFCGGQGYERVYLWTIDILEAARKLYGQHGFRPAEEKINTEWTGAPIREERWELTL